MSKKMRALLIGPMVLLASACGGDFAEDSGVSAPQEEVLGQDEAAVCPAGNYTSQGTCYDWGAGPYTGVCGSTTYSYWQCTQYKAVINGQTYYYRAYCGPQVEACSLPTPKCLQNC